jgi:hypothetical protein
MPHAAGQQAQHTIAGPEEELSVIEKMGNRVDQWSLALGLGQQQCVRASHRLHVDPDVMHSRK